MVVGMQHYRNAAEAISSKKRHSRYSCPAGEKVTPQRAGILSSHHHPADFLGS
jgi:hypothetical protein